MHHLRTRSQARLIVSISDFRGNVICHTFISRQPLLLQSGIWRALSITNESRGSSSKPGLLPETDEGEANAFSRGGKNHRRIRKEHKMVKKRECCDVAAIGTKSRNLHGHTGFGKPIAINLAAGAGALYVLQHHSICCIIVFP